MPKKTGGLPWIWLSLIILIIDEVVKFVIVAHLYPYEYFPVIPGFRLTLAYNTGAAFSFLGTASGWQIWLFSGLAIVISIGIVVWLRRLEVSQRWLCIALALILAGAIGNLVDRLTLGYVIDYFVLYAGRWTWPAFNVADTSISIGVVMLLIDVLLRKKQKHDSK